MGQELSPFTVGCFGPKGGFLSSCPPCGSATAPHSFRAHRPRVVGRQVCGHQHIMRWHPGKKQSSGSKGCKTVDKTGAQISHLPYKTWQVSALEPGQSLELIAVALPTLTLVFAKALTGLQHDECTHTLIL